MSRTDDVHDDALMRNGDSRHSTGSDDDAPNDVTNGASGDSTCEDWDQGSEKIQLPDPDPLVRVGRTADGRRIQLRLSTAVFPNRIRDKLRVETQLRLPEAGDPCTEFFARRSGGTLIARGYDRVVYGDHGPYVELSDHNVQWSAFPHFKPRSPWSHYDLWATSDHRLMLYAQKRNVSDKPNPPWGQWAYCNNRPEGYADYRVSKFYVPCEVHEVAVKISKPLVGGHLPKSSAAAVVGSLIDPFTDSDSSSAQDEEEDDEKAETQAAVSADISVAAERKSPHAPVTVPPPERSGGRRRGHKSAVSREGDDAAVANGTRREGGEGPPSPESKPDSGARRRRRRRAGAAAASAKALETAKALEAASLNVANGTAAGVKAEEGAMNGAMKPGVTAGAPAIDAKAEEAAVNGVKKKAGAKVEEAESNGVKKPGVGTNGGTNGSARAAGKGGAAEEVKKPEVVKPPDTICASKPVQPT
eukprot:gnl/TRDRNA2_/TRDRNA2_81443_c0_seq1.p1 gnl/TRDRNA2_/TRDRNA2_81443_c0~~gnl/TRDRNA2_/TRDRNA2_81443_c0_seq1.p1  ORF type:complete len:492 (+),score=72.83 gnl/TRDRNA2_/TRDRNA2_81443_c0_seq1:59-1477(+)